MIPEVRPISVLFTIKWRRDATTHSNRDRLTKKLLATDYDGNICGGHLPVIGPQDLCKAGAVGVAVLEVFASGHDIRLLRYRRQRCGEDVACFERSTWLVGRQVDAYGSAV